MKIYFAAFLVIIIVVVLFKDIFYFNHNMRNIMNLTKQISIYRPVESENLKRVKQILLDKMRDIGLMPNTQDFKKTIGDKEYSFSNLIGFNPNSKGPYIILGAHIDSPQIEGCESAIDAATSVAIIIELISDILSKYPNAPIMALFIDGEEAINGKWSNTNTLTGSRYFVDNIDSGMKIAKVYIFDLIGGEFDCKIATFQDLPGVHDDLFNLAKINEKYDKKIFISPTEYISPHSPMDDHVPFFERNIPVANLIPYKFPKVHHTLADTYENINWEYIQIFYEVFREFIFRNLLQKSEF
jgi:hypothetical protein